MEGQGGSRESDQIGDAWWAALVAKVLSPSKIEIIEALRWINLPLSAIDLAEIIEGLPRSSLTYHLRTLQRLDAVEVAERPTLQNMTAVRFRLTDEDRSDDSRSPMAVRFGENLRTCRNKAGISQETLGFRTSLHRTEISLLERGGREPLLGTIIKLASALSIPISKLVGDIHNSGDVSIE